MKILVLSDLYPPDVIGGYELGCRQAVDALRARGHDVRVLTSAPRTPVAPQGRVLRRLKLTDVWDHDALGRQARVVYQVIESRSHLIDSHNIYIMSDSLEGFPPDVTYVWMLVGVGGLGLMACLQHLGRPWVWHLMDDVPLCLCRTSGRFNTALARELGARLSGHYPACSQQLVDEIESGGVCLRGTVEIVPNWVEVGEWPGRANREPLPGGRLRIVSAGQVNREKGFDLIIQAAALLRDRGFERFSIDIYGTIADLSLENLIRNHELSDLVFLKGTLEQRKLLPLYADYDVFAFPTRLREPFGFAPLEAAAFGCVPVVSQTCGISEWLVDGVHCLKIRRSAEALADRLGEIMAGKIDLRPIAPRCAAVVRRDFNLKAILPRIERALAEASRATRRERGRPEDAYRMAVLAEKLNDVIINEM